MRFLGTQRSLSRSSSELISRRVNFRRSQTIFPPLHKYIFATLSVFQQDKSSLLSSRFYHHLPGGRSFRKPATRLKRSWKTWHAPDVCIPYLLLIQVRRSCEAAISLIRNLWVF